MTNEYMNGEHALNEKQKNHEELILGILMHYPLIQTAKTYINEDMFYIKQNKEIYKAMLQLNKEGENIDMATVLGVVSDSEYLTTIFSATSKSDNMGYAENFKKHLLILVELHMKQQSLVLAKNLYKGIYEDNMDAFDVVDLIKRTGEELKPRLGNGVKDTTMLVEELYETINTNSSQGKQGVKIGFKDIDEFTEGYQNGDLIVLAGATSMGKTSMMISQIVKQLEMGQRIGVWSLEMTSLQLTGRIMSQLTGLSSKHITMGILTDYEVEKINEHAQRLIESNLFIIESQRGLNWIEASIEDSVQKYSLDGVYIDYLQLMSIKGLSKRDAMGECANSLKVTAKSLKIPIHLGSQFKRVETGSSYPTLDMLKESGDIENAADVVVGLWRPEYFEINDINFKGETIPSEGVGLYIILKGRNIGLNKFLLKWNAPKTQFADWTPFNPFEEKINKPNKDFDNPF